MAFIGKVPTPVPLTSSDITDGIITSAKITDGTIATADIADGAVTSVKTTGVGGDNTPAFRAKRSAEQSISSSTWTKVQFNTELFDTDNCYDNSTNYRFTPTTAGKYFVYGLIRHDWSSNWGFQVFTAIYKNGSEYLKSEFYGNGTSVQTYHARGVSDIIDFNGTSDYVELYGYHNATGALFSGTHTVFGAYKIIT